MKMTKLTLVALAALFASSVALAATPTFKKADTNGDGVVDEAEFAATKVKREYGKLDKNGDGKLDKKEYSVLLDEDCA